MKQVLHHLGSGETTVEEQPCPKVRPGHLLIRSHVSLISSGTERSVVAFGQANLWNKAKAQPEQVRRVLEKVRTDGLLATWEAVRDKLDQPLPLGYSNAGRVLAVGEGVTDFAVGDRVASNGRHAEAVLVPRHLCARIPAGVGDTQAAFTVLGAIALQGLRLAQPTLGETFAVFGLGLVGQLTVQLLKAQGCRILAIDLDGGRLELARRSGADATVDLSGGADPVAAALALSGGRGVDGALLTAATRSSEPVHQAAQMCRQRGRVVLVGVTGLELQRSDFYEKELTFQVSCSYGPGRYDPQYEERGHDYPLGFVRWTEQRNLEAVLALLAEGRLAVDPLISHRFPVEQAEAAYEVVTGGGESLAILLDYPDEAAQSDAVVRSATVAVAASPPLPAPAAPAEPVVGVVGTGGYATRVLLPALRRCGVVLHSVASSGGVSGTHASRKFGARYSSTDAQSLLVHPELNTIVIATRHDSHAELACAALRAGKHVFVEKPLAITEAQLEQVAACHAETRRGAGGPLLMVGFNRRFAPHVLRMKKLLAALPGPKSFIMTVNAGAVPASHWTQDAQVGGGRIVGEGCHFIDLLRHLAGVPVTGTQVSSQVQPGGGDDVTTFVLTFQDGSIGTVHYLASGHRAFPKERLEVFAAGRILALDNFRVLRGYGWPSFRRQRLWRQDKGNAACMAAFVQAVRQGGAAPIPFDELAEVTRVSLRVAAAARR